MSALVDFVALSPAAADVVAGHCRGLAGRRFTRRTFLSGSTERPATTSSRLPRSIRLRAAAAIVRARERHIDAIAWSDPQYPPALAAIIDPPPVLWLRGQRDGPRTTLGCHCRIASGVPVRAVGRGAARGRSRGAWSCCCQRPGARCGLGGSPGCAQGRRHDDRRAWVGGRRDVPARTLRARHRHDGLRGRHQRADAGDSATGPVLSAAQSRHQRIGAGAS